MERNTILVAVGAVLLTLIFLWMVLPSHEPPVAPPGPRATRTLPRPLKGPTRPQPVAKAEKGLLTGTVMLGGRPYMNGQATVMVVPARVPNTPVTSTITGGTYRFTGLEPGRYWVSAIAIPGSAAFSRLAQVGDAPCTVDLDLHPGAKLSGLVRDEAGQPVPGAIVTAEETLDGMGALPTLHQASTDKDGRYAFALLAPGKYRLDASAKGMDGKGAAVELKEGKKQDVLLTLAKVQWKELRVWVLGSVGPSQIKVDPAECRVREEKTNTFIVSAPPGRITLRAMAPGYAWSEAREFTVGEDTGVTIDLGAQKGFLEGRVLTGDGKPAADALVECIAASGETGQGQTSVAASVRTMDDGWFRINGFHEGDEYTIHVTAQGCPLAQHGPVKASMSDIEVVVGEVNSASISGRVTTNDPTAGAPRWTMKVHRIRDGSEILAGELASDRPAEPASPSFTATANGGFSLTGLIPGTYFLHVESSGFAPMEVGPLTVPGGAKLSGVAIVLGKGRSISGVVCGKTSGQPIAGAKLTLLDGGEPLTQTGADGIFQVQHVAPGAYTLRVSHEAYREVETPVEVTADADVTGLRITMDDSTGVAGKVTDADGKPVSTGRVAILYGKVRREADIKDGRYEIRGLDPGDYYHLLAQAPGLCPLHIEGIPITSNQIAAKDVHMTKGGALRLVVQSKGKGITGVKVGLQWEDGLEVQPLALSGSDGKECEGSGADGVVMIQRVPTSPLVLRLTKGATTREVSVSVPDGATLTLPIAWPGE